MKRFLLLLLLALIPILPGCMVVSAAVGVGGYALSGPAQYAGTAFSLCEYSYELAVNDKTQDLVFKDKVLEVVDILDGPDYVGAWETALAATDPDPQHSVTLESLTLAYNLQDLPEALRPAPALQGPVLPGARPLPPALLAENRPAPPAQPAQAPAPARPGPSVSAPAPSVELPGWPTLAQVQAPAPARPGPSVSAPAPSVELPGWPTLAQVQAPAQSGWSVRLPVSGVVL